MYMRSTFNGKVIERKGFNGSVFGKHSFVYATLGRTDRLQPMFPTKIYNNILKRVVFSTKL